jgi:cell fate regulator YaaT (PSP1 superfamily)
MNTYDWLSYYDFEDPSGTDIVEISFKKGARKEFFRNHPQSPVQTRDMVVVDTGSGYDVGVVSLTGELVRLQMKKKRVKEQTVTNPVIRVANDRDIDRLNEYRRLEQQAMVRARAISNTLGLDMKICDVEYRGDGRKATFYYTAEGRVDFRELVRLYAKEFQVKVEMRQIGARQESSRIGGVGICGRELCCSTWLTDFKSVNTHAARYQNLSINQAKLSGQCGRLKCCLNYELDTYMEAIEEFPQDVDVLKYQGGSASLIKMDIFKRLLYYSVEVEKGRNTVMALSLDRVKEVKGMNLKGAFPEQLQDPNALVEEEKLDFADVTGDIELPDVKKKRKKKKGKGQQGQSREGQRQGGQPGGQQREARQGEQNRRREDNRDRRQEGGQKPQQPREGQPRQPQQPREGQPRQQNQPRPQNQQPKREDGQNPQNPQQPRTDRGPQQEGGGKNRNRNRNRNKNRGPRPEGGDPPSNTNTPS